MFRLDKSAPSSLGAIGSISGSYWSVRIVLALLLLTLSRHHSPTLPPHVAATLLPAPTLSDDTIRDSNCPVAASRNYLKLLDVPQSY